MIYTPLAGFTPFARLNDLQIGQAKTTKKSNEYIPSFAGVPAWLI
jgi:hypothetical protein